MAYSKSDIFHLENDLDLDLILGETKSCVKYQCPECDKCYESISRKPGHITGKHGYEEVKAFDYLKGTAPITLPESKTDSKTGYIFIQKSRFEEIITETMPTSVENVGNNKFRNMKSSVYGGGIVKLANAIMKDTQAIPALTSMLFEPFYKVFNSEPKPDNNTKEAIYMNYYEQTLDIIRPLTKLLTNMHEPDIPARQFAAVLLRQLLNDLIEKSSAMYETTVESENISGNDQSVLFYFSGFLIHALDKSVKRLTPEERQATYAAIDRMQVKTDEQFNSLAVKFPTSTEKLNREELKIPSEDMFLLVREMEFHSRNVAMCDLPTRTEILLDTFMIKYYSERMMSGKYCSSILERLISIFLTIRGTAVVRNTAI